MIFMNFLKKNAFSLIELIIIILIIGILAGIGIPRFVDLRNEALEATEEASVHSIRSGIKLYSVDSALKNRKPFYPDVLDTSGGGQASGDNPLFGVILQTPITDRHWSKVSAMSYKGPTGEIYTYDPVEGVFNK
jgi:general secretion pathway protein G